MSRTTGSLTTIATPLTTRYPELFTQHPGPPLKPRLFNNQTLYNDLWKATALTMPQASRDWLEGFVDMLLIEDERPDIAYTVGCYILAGFLEENRYRREMFQPREDDPEFKLKSDSLDGLDLYIGQTKQFLPVAYSYHELAVRVARDEPQEERSMARLNDQLPFAWQIVDAAIHASGKVTEIHLFALSCIWHKSGHVPTHACSCSSRSASMTNNGIIDFQMGHMIHERPDESTEGRAQRIQERLGYLIQHAAFSHTVVELMLLLGGFPTGVRHSRQLKDAQAKNLFQRLYRLTGVAA